MAIHANLSPEAQLRLQSQLRTSTLSSLLISILTVVLVGLLLMFFLLPSIEEVTPEIVTRRGEEAEVTKTPEKQMQRKVQPKPSSPSFSMAKVMAANVVSQLSMPVPDTHAEISLDLGNGDGLGDGWGNGEEWGEGGPGTTFFGQDVKAERVVYVIDYSRSMNGKRIRLLKKELMKSVNQLPDGTQYQLIFFAGPAWLAGDQVTMAGDRKSAEVISGERSYRWESPRGGAHSWEPKGSKQRALWLSADVKQLKLSSAAIEETPLVWGTDWARPLEMALEMKPTPQVICFMTDGAVGGAAEQVAKSIARKAKSRDCKINTVALMQPGAESAMKEMAEISGGQYALVDERGQVKK
ncbi:VWA domain-containing protein [Verrucomicrobiaceae bacterium 5K15]|uniref:VWA domain-containing protein n=1 Tax=Oceaniferula flava TaxID=2800421 RepID=A0AAE2VBN4_9BACT|nr:vWA domain-containing protein [Oceaniferula flavus]MBK1854021.1 VWA domain-containing protein [Oceaniferula flavus]MBM1135327.1 VWA domain-containing protein [Oceaniferula flavus]